MANNNNLARPPILENPPLVQAPQINQQPQQINQQPPPPVINQRPIVTAADLTAVVTNIVRNVLRGDSEQIVRDQAINPEYRNNLSELDKIPDIVRSLREFSGKEGEFSSWRKSVERILTIYEPTAGSPKYYGLLNVIRNKITGNADAVLEAYNTPLDWKAICKCLALHYADQRDLGTLEYQMTSLVQGNKTTQQFYQIVYNHLSLILNKISCMDVGPESLSLLTRTYRDKALDTFVRGLNGDLPRLLGIREPTDLPQALNLCLKLENQTFRATHANQIHNTFQNKAWQHPVPQQPQRNIPLMRPQIRQLPVKQNFYPEIAHLPQQNLYPTPPRPNQNYHQYNHPPPRPMAPKPQPKPEPMETSTIGSAHVNYQNRPQPPKYAGKRQQNTSFQNQVPHKIQRNFHIDINNPEPSTSLCPNDEIVSDPVLQPSNYISPNDVYAFYDTNNLEEIKHDPDLTQYVLSQNYEESNDMEFSDINFLD